MDTSGPKLTAEQVAQVAYNAGFRGSDLARMVAISYRESGWYPGNNGRNTNGTVDHGLWMINDVNKEELAMGDWRDPQTNANMAMALYKKAQRMWGDGFRPWVANNTGAYLVMLPTATAAANKITEVKPINYDGKTSGGGSGGKPQDATLTSSSSDSGLDSLTNPISAIAKFFKFISDPGSWKRLGLFVFGGIAIAIGLWYLIKPTAVGQAVKSTANKAKQAATMAVML